VRAGAVLLFALVALVLVGAAPASANSRPPFLWQCEQIHRDDQKDACYVRLLLQDIDRSGDPANELPRIDRRVRAADTALSGRCHALMHIVGRRWAREHHLTLDGLQKVVPRSNDPGCSAGFGMGIVMYLGPEIISNGGSTAARACAALPTRMRAFTCVHSLGHALMRGYHESLFLAVNACVRLGPADAADCAQGVFHDYWIALRGADETTSPVRVVRSPRTLCARYPRFALACWYRYFVEQPAAPTVASADDLAKVCSGLAGGQRAGCIAAASKTVQDTPAGQAGLCTRLPAAADAVACLRGVANQTYAGRPVKEVRLFGACARMPAAARDACAAWFGRTFNVLENGRFLRSGCPKLAAAAVRACAVGARRWAEPLVTFS
jgi:hypothetical protein